MIEKIQVKFQKLHASAVIPKYKTSGAAGMDLSSCEHFQLEPGEIKVVNTGLRIKLLPGYEAQVRPRSGLAAGYGITVLNSPGTIDSDYLGEIGVILINHGHECCEFTVGDRIAQLVISPAPQVSICEVDTIDVDTDRGESGFGSTGL